MVILRLLVAFRNCVKSFARKMSKVLCEIENKSEENIPIRNVWYLQYLYLNLIELTANEVRYTN